MADLWIFGYGSLIFKADFPYLKRTPATLPGWTRRFWQASTDHRGTPNFPGRVVTLVEAPDISCWGMAYLIEANQVDEVLSHLDYREKGGYRRLDADITLTTGEEVRGLTYLADSQNPEYLGEASFEQMAWQIRQATGPSGANIDYLLKLEASLREHEVEDDHVFRLADTVRKL